MKQFENPSDIPIAIIGMGCKLPGGDGLDEYWKLLVEGRSAVVEFPPDRLDRELYYDPKVGVRNKTYSSLGALLTNREFNHEACPIADEIVQSADNVHLLMCETVAAACRHAKLDPMNLKPKNTGVFIGNAQGSELGGDLTYATCVEEAAHFLKDVPDFLTLDGAAQQSIIDEVVARVRAKLPEPSTDAPDVAANMVAGTVCKAFGLTGPFVATDAACASSLQAMLQGVRALQLGRIDMAVVGGASDSKSDPLVLFSHARSLSATGTRPFDADADGLIIAEGYVALVLKTLPQALADGDPIQAVVRGMGISSDGKGKSLWAPRKEGQMEAIKRAYRCGVDMSTIQYIEAHATATQVGDATELNTIGEFLGGCLEPGRKIPIGGVKANIGHTLESAGVAGMIKTVLAMQNETIPPAINVNNLNPKIPWDDVPVYVPMEATSWNPPADGQPRRAGVNAFGIGGLNMHIVLEQFDESTREERRATTPTLRPRTADERAVAIVGMGCILPGALNVEEYWDLLVSGRDPKQQVPADRWNTELSCRSDSNSALAGTRPIGGFITNFEYDWRTHKVPPKQVAQADPLQFMLLEAADQAMSDAGYHEKPFDRTRCGVLVGSEFGGDFAFQLQVGLRLPELERHIQQVLAERGVAVDRAQKIAADYSDALLKRWPALVDETGSFTASSLASRISKTWNLMGGATAIDSGSASAMAALAISVDALLAGDTDMMICTAGQQRMGLPQFEAMALNGILADQDSLRAPLDAGSTGYVPGEGVGCVVLKRLADARRDGDRIRGVIRGVGAAHGDSSESAVEMAAERALADAGVSPADVRVAELDTTGFHSTDAEQFSAIRSVYGSKPRRKPLLLNSVTAQIGHTEGASGMASMIKTCLETENRQVVAAFGMESPCPTLAEAAPALECAMQNKPLESAPEDQPLAAVNSTTRQLAYHVIVQRGAPVLSDAAPPAAAPAVDAAPTNWKIYHVGASTPEQLAQRLTAASSGLNNDLTSLVNGEFKERDAVRLAVVADGPVTLNQRLGLAQKLAANPAAWTSAENQGVFFRQINNNRPRIAFMFAGQGSQYAGMLQQLVQQEPAAAAALAECNAALTQLGHKTFDEMMWQNAPMSESDVWTPQASMLVADYIMYQVLCDRGIRPDLVAGHSYGEYAALLAAGAWDLETALRITRARCDAIENAAALGGMLATTAPVEVVEQLAANLTPAVYVANHNAPDQVVVGGPREVLEQLDARLQQQSYQAKILQVPCPFHTPWMQPTAQPLADALASADLRAPQVPLWSVANNQQVASADDIRSNLVAHMTSPVRYVDLIQTIAAEQPTVFIEVGPQQVLTRLHQRILQNADAAAVASDNPKRPAAEQLLSVQALLESVGAWGSKPSSAVPASSQATPKGRGEILTFDATARRRDKMRHASGSPAAEVSAPAAAPAPRVAPRTPVAQTIATSRISEPTLQPTADRSSNGTSKSGGGNGSTNGNGFDPHSSYQRRPAVSPQSVQNGHAPTTAAPSENGHTNGQPSQTAATVGKADTADLETFLINFVVEQTGYPADVVELDADLEADLGIDSIKKAQLFGELQEFFDVTPSEDLTLDDFPTLRHVMDFLSNVEAKTDLAAASPDVAENASQTATPPANGAAAAPSAAQPATADLEQFLINFVVEQTGYPADVVELDADLEADLGIDSIKKAQLFGELQEYFDVTPSEDLTLDDFPTLRHVMDFLAGVDAKTDLGVGTTTVAETAAVPATAAPAVAEPTATPAAAPPTAELEEFLINFVVEQTGYPADVVELDADLEADLGIDSIKKAQLFGELQEFFDVTPTEDLTLDDFPTLRHVMDFLSGVEAKTDLGVGARSVGETVPAAAPTTPAVAEPVAPRTAATPAATTTDTNAPAAAELEQFLINFVVEQTGYPADVVELDADLEADLGIDSIKKAQLFGELQEFFDVTPTEDLTLDDFPTLRHVMDFLSGVEAKTDLGVSTPSATPERVAPSAVAAPVSPATATTAPATAELELFLINFVVEQTGYPADVVELDADLEADLGIDSIKKAQLFGELQEYFDVTPTEDLTLDDFPTLRHVMDFLSGVEAKADLGVSVPESDQLAAAQPNVTTPIAAEPVASAAVAARPTEELEQFLINFVVEQTGYPADVVELDADLEADLGIDSIKKAQLFGELQEYFDVTPSEDLTLDDFPTLRHVMDFLADAPSKGEFAEESQSAPAPTAPVSSSPTSNGYAATHSSAPAATAVASDVRSTSDAYELGHTYGHENQASIRTALRHYADLPDAARPNIPLLSTGNQDLASLFDERQLDQLQGIADAVEVPLGNIVALRLTQGDAQTENDPLGLNPQDAEPLVASPSIDDLFAVNETTGRYTIRMIEVPLPDDSPESPTFNGPALVIGDNPDATALRQRLTELGVKVQTLSISADLDATLAAFEKLWQAEPIMHLFLTSARDSGVSSPYDDAGWRERQHDGTLVPFFLTQRWVQLATDAKLLEKCSLVGLASLGGDTGFSGRVASVDSAAISALIKSLYIEFYVLQDIKGLKVVSIDAPVDEPSDRFARNILREAASSAIDYEVAYVGDSRRLQNGIASPVEPKPAANVRPGGVWIVTGGARGVTAACALEMGRRFDLRLHLLGTSTEPDVDNTWRNLSEDETKKLRASVMADANQRGENMESAWARVEKAIEIDRCLRAYQDANVRATYHQCDVSDQQQVAAALESIRASDGPIEGIIHGAGIDVSCRFQKKQRDIVRATIGAKADGARHLMALTREDPVSYFIGFGSISGRFGSNGQADYSVASDLLAKLISWYRSQRPSCRATCIHWHPWDEVGMATRPAALAALKAGLAPELMPLAEGVRHFVREVHAGLPDSEVLVTNNEYFRRYYSEGTEQIPSAPPLPEPGATPSEAVSNATNVSTEQVTRRLVVRMYDAPLTEQRPLSLNGMCLILGDNTVSRELEWQLQQYGGDVHVLASGDDTETVLAEFERLAQHSPITHLFLMTAHDDDACIGVDEADLARRRTRGVLNPFILCQRWIEHVGKANLFDKATLTACTTLGGDFGISGKVTAAESGALAGLLKGIFVEGTEQPWSSVRIKVIDTNDNESTGNVAQVICEELASDAPEVEVAYEGQTRRIARTLMQPSAEGQPIAQGGTWVITGGARGITALVAMELGKRFGAKMHLIGSSPVPKVDPAWHSLSDDENKELKLKVSREARTHGDSPAAAWNKLQKALEIDRNLHAFRDAGVSVTYHQCDVSNRAKLASVLETVRQADGSIDGIVHGAGVTIDSLFPKKKPENILRTFAAKVDGAASLMALTEQDPVRYFVGFGSVSGRYGANGQTDYCAANDMLSKLINAYSAQHPECAAVGVHWHGWAGAGMAVKPELKAIFEASNFKLMPPGEGIDHLMNELATGAPDAEVVITDDRHYRETYPVEIVVDPVAKKSHVEQPRSAAVDAPRPLVDRVVQQQVGQQVTVEANFDPAADPFLVEHRMSGTPILPAVVAAELIVEAASSLDSRYVVALRDLTIHSPLAFGSGEPRKVQVSVEAHGEQAECRITADQFDRQNRLVESARLMVSAVAELAAQESLPTDVYCGQPPLGWFPMRYPEGAPVEHGPKLRYLKNLFCQHDGGFARIEVPPMSDLAGSRDDRGWSISPAVLDACLVACSSYSFVMCGQRMEIPQGFDRLELVCMPREGEECVARIYFRGNDAKVSRYDFVLFGEDERVILKAQGYRAALLASGEVTL